MIVVVADTSPLNYLIQIKADHVLPALYARLFVPAAVVEELRHPHAVAAVRAWLTHVPAWLLVQHVDEGSGARLARLDRGERHAIHWPRGNTPTCCSWMRNSASASRANRLGIIGSQSGTPCEPNMAISTSVLSHVF